MFNKARTCVAAGVVTYNPDIDLLRQNIDAVIDLVDALLIVDNGSANIEELRQLMVSFKTRGYEQTELIEFENNLGIAAALNCLLQKGKEKGYKWVLTLDQDSRVPDNIINANAEKLLCDERIGIISAVIDNKNRPAQKLKREDRLYSEIKKCITSASLTSVDSWERVGGFDEWMFIDEVDHEFCARLRKCGYSILRNNEVVLTHSIGKAHEARFLWKKITFSSHSPFRKYYQIRNLIYESRKIHGRITIYTLYMLCRYYAKVIIFEDNRIEKLKKMNQGLLDGLKTRPEKFEA